MIDMALAVARANPVENLPKMAAVIARRKKVISVGLNSFKTDPLQSRFSPHPLAICKHAEIDAIKNALKAKKRHELRGSTIFVARVARNGAPALAKPCDGCRKALKAYGISQAFWTTDKHGMN
jgi:tRNA(Arg) A34 adenosine deaminase TadA